MTQPPGPAGPQSPYGPSPHDPPPPGSPPYGSYPGWEPPGRPPRRWGWWVTGGAAIAAALVVVLVLALVSGGDDDDGSDFTYVRDQELEQGLLTQDDVPAGFTIEVLDQEDLDALNVNAEPPEGVSPEKCADILTQGPVGGTFHVGAARIVPPISGVGFAEIIARVDEGTEGDWSPARYEQLFDECGTISAEVNGRDVTYTLDRLDVEAMGDRTVAFSVTSESPSVSITTGLALRGDRVITLVAVGQTRVDPVTEFLPVFRAAVRKATP